MPRIIVYKKDRGDLMFPADTMEQIYEASLAILKDRYQEGWYQVDKVYREDQPDVPLETVRTLPRGKTRVALEKEWEEHNNRLSRYDYDRRIQIIAKMALKKRDGMLARYVLDRYPQNGEDLYEIVDLNSGIKNSKLVSGMFSAPIVRSMNPEFFEFSEKLIKSFNDDYKIEYIGSCLGAPIYRVIRLRGRCYGNAEREYLRLLSINYKGNKEVFNCRIGTSDDDHESYPMEWAFLDGFDPITGAGA